MCSALVQVADVAATRATIRHTAAALPSVREGGGMLRHACAIPLRWAGWRATISSATRHLGTPHVTGPWLAAWAGDRAADVLSPLIRPVSMRAAASTAEIVTPQALAPVGACRCRRSTHDFATVIIKELVDKAIDAAEQAGRPSLIAAAALADGDAPSRGEEQRR